MQANPTPSSTVNPLKGPNFHSPLVTIVIGFYSFMYTALKLDIKYCYKI